MDEIRKFSMSVNQKPQLKPKVEKEKTKETFKEKSKDKNKHSKPIVNNKILHDNLKLMMKEESKLPQEGSIRKSTESKENRQSSEKRQNTSRNSESKSKEKDTTSTKKSKKVAPIVKTENKPSVVEKKNYAGVKSKVKNYIEEKKPENSEEKSEKPLSKKKTKKENEKEKTKSELILSKKVKYTQNFCAIDLKKNWKEKKLVKAPNMRKHKLKKEKYFNKLRKNLASIKDEKYLGRGKSGLDEIDPTKDSDEIPIDYGGNNFKDDPQVKVPFFSEGYFINELNSSSKMLEDGKSTKEAMIASDKKEVEIIEIPPSLVKQILEENQGPTITLSVTPGKQDVTKRLSTIMKSSIGKKLALDTELRKMSNEFRFLLSGKKCNTDENVDKKLNFNEENAIAELPNESSVDESMKKEEIEALESDILKQVLNENFKMEDFKKGQIETIKNLLNGKSTLLILPPAAGKSLCYQVPALVLDGLTIVVSPMISLITDQLTQLPSCLAGASLSGNTSYRQRNEIFEAIKSKKIKILFITPERMSIENFQDIGDVSLICFDEANCCCPLSQSFRSAYVTVNNIINNLNPGVMLFLANNSTALTEEYLARKYNLETIKEPITYANNLKISITKDDSKINALVKLMNTKPYKNIGSTIIFCNLKKNVDKVASYLNSKGITCVKYHSGLPFIDRQIIQTNFMKGDSKIIVATMGFLMGISKTDIRMIVVYDIPPNPELFIQQIGRGGRDKRESYVHVFLNDEDYFAQRNLYLMENIDKTQVLKFLECCFNNSTGRNTKRSFNEAFEDNEKPKQITLPKTLAINFNTINSITGIKKQVQISLLMNLLETNDIEGLKLKCIGICPVNINLRFFKTAAEELMKTEDNLKMILEGVIPFQGIYRVNVMEACEKLGFTNFQLLDYFYSLQTKGELGYDVKDEGMFLEVEELPSSFVTMINFLLEKHQYLIKLNIKKLNCSYVFLRKFAMVSIESLLKHDKSSSVKCLTHYSSFADYEKEFKETIEKYFCLRDDDADVILAGDKEELQKILPIIILETHKEKNSISKDIEDVMKREYENNSNLTSIDMINILFGIHVNETKNFYNSNPLWNRYHQYEYDVIKELVDNAFLNVKSETIAKNTFKKKKAN